MNYRASCGDWKSQWVISRCRSRREWATSRLCIRLARLSAMYSASSRNACGKMRSMSGGRKQSVAESQQNSARLIESMLYINKLLMNEGGNCELDHLLQLK